MVQEGVNVTKGVQHLSLEKMTFCLLLCPFYYALCLLYTARNIGVDILPKTRSGVEKESSIRAGDRGHSGSQDRSSHLANKERNGHDCE
jgi:hypothetical protein